VVIGVLQGSVDNLGSVVYLDGVDNRGNMQLVVYLDGVDKKETKVQLEKLVNQGNQVNLDSLVGVDGLDGVDWD